MRGNRTVKTNSGGLDAFESPNYPALAKVDTRLFDALLQLMFLCQQLEIGIRFKPSMTLSPPKGRFRVHTHMETNVAVWRMIPGILACKSLSAPSTVMSVAGFDDEYITNSVTYAAKLRAIVLG
jgi:L-asparaginase/Glu-tRNA(Gln) amidotransferase subunit D